MFQHPGGDAPPDSQAALQAQAVDSAVAATDEIAQQLSDKEQESVRSAVASAAQRVAQQQQQQQQQATLMTTGQAYPQVLYCCCMSPSVQCDALVHMFVNLKPTHIQHQTGHTCVPFATQHAEHAKLC